MTISILKFSKIHLKIPIPNIGFPIFSILILPILMSSNPHKAHPDKPSSKNEENFDIDQSLSSLLSDPNFDPPSSSSFHPLPPYTPVPPWPSLYSAPPGLPAPKPKTIPVYPAYFPYAISHPTPQFWMAYPSVPFPQPIPLPVANRPILQPDIVKSILSLQIYFTKHSLKYIKFKEIKE